MEVLKESFFGELSKFYKPRKKLINIRLDADVLDWIKSREIKYQTKINKILRDYVEQQNREKK